MAAPLLAGLGKAALSVGKSVAIKKFSKPKNSNLGKGGPLTFKIGGQGNGGGGDTTTRIRPDRGGAIIKSPSFKISLFNPSSDNDILSVIRDKVLEIEGLVDADFKARQSQIKDDKKDEEKEKRKVKELKSESKFKGLKGFSIPIPGKGLVENIFGKIFNFFLWVALGKILPSLINFIPIIGRILGFISKLMNPIISIGGAVLNGFISIVTNGHKAIKKAESLLNFITGGKLEPVIEKFKSTLDVVLNLALIAALSSIGGGGGGGDPLTGIKGPKGLAGRSRYGTSAAAARRYAQRFGKDAAIRKFGKKGVRSLGGKYARSGLTNVARKGVVGVLGKGGTKAALEIVKPLVKNIPLIGGIMEFVLSWMSGDSVGKAAFKGVGTGLGTWLGGALGTLMGPGIGTGIGMFLGGMGGSALGGLLYDAIFTGKQPVKPSSNLKKKAIGGKVRSKNAKNKSYVNIQKRNIKEPIKYNEKLIPGQDVGGSEKIKALYSKIDFKKSKQKEKSQSTSTQPQKAWWDPLGLFTGKTSASSIKDPDGIPKEVKSYTLYEFLVDTSKDIKQLPLIGRWMGAGIDMIMGHKPSKKVYESFANDMTYLAQSLAQQQERSSVFDILSKLEDGGTVPSLSSIRRANKKRNTDMARSLYTMISSEVNSKMQRISGVLMDAFSAPAMAMTPDIRDRDPRARGGYDPRYDQPSSGGGGGGGGVYKPILDLIAKYEAGSGKWESMYPNTKLPGATKMTIAEVARRATGAVGMYQNLPQYLNQRARAVGLDPNTALYNEENQRKIAVYLIERGQAGVTPKMLKDNPDEAMIRLARVWAAIPVPRDMQGARRRISRGDSYYAGVGNNKAHITPEMMYRAMGASVKLHETSQRTSQTPTKSPDNRPSAAGGISRFSHPDTGSGYGPSNSTDQSGRPIVLSKYAAQSFKKMIEDSGMNLGSYVASSGRSEAKNTKEGGHSNSHHMYGEALDINGTGYQWMLKNASKYGWKYGYNHNGGSAHFIYVGKGAGTTPKLMRGTPPSIDNRRASYEEPRRNNRTVVMMVPVPVPTKTPGISGDTYMSPLSNSTYERASNNKLDYSFRG